MCIGKSSISLADIRQGYGGSYSGWIAIYEPDSDSDSDIPAGLLRVRIVVEDNVEASFDENSQALRRRSEQLLFPDAKESKDNEEEIKIFVGTWNVANSSPPENFSEFIQMGGPFPFTMYVLCFQESDIVSGAATNTPEWLNFLGRQFGDNYVCIAKASIWQIRQFIYLRKDLVPHVSGFHVCDETTGIHKLLGNKGGIAIAFN